MKNRQSVVTASPVKHLIGLGVLTVRLLLLILPGATAANSLTNLYSFPTNSATPTDSEPESALLLYSNTLYGTTVYGGSNGVGTVFKVATDGTGFANLHIFSSRLQSARLANFF
jgi:uncharacterized repeat protein (TIGR03803 family)